MKYTHDIPLAELDGQHAKSLDCPCGIIDVEQVTPTSAIVYHQRRTTRGYRPTRAKAERVAAHKRDSGRPL